MKARGLLLVCCCIAFGLCFAVGTMPRQPNCIPSAETRWIGEHEIHQAILRHIGRDDKASEHTTYHGPHFTRRQWLIDWARSARSPRLHVGDWELGWSHSSGDLREVPRGARAIARAPVLTDDVRMCVLWIRVRGLGDESPFAGGDVDGN